MIADQKGAWYLEVNPWSREDVFESAFHIVHSAFDRLTLPQQPAELNAIREESDEGE